MIEITRIEAEYILETIAQTLDQLDELAEEVYIHPGVYDYLHNADHIIRACIEKASEEHVEYKIDAS